MLKWVGDYRPNVTGIGQVMEMYMNNLSSLVRTDTFDTATGFELVPNMYIHAGRKNKNTIHISKV